MHNMATIIQAFALSLNQSRKTDTNIIMVSGPLLTMQTQLVVRYLQYTYRTAYVSLITLEFYVTETPTL